MIFQVHIFIHWFITHDTRFKQFFGFADVAEGEPELQPHHIVCGLIGDSRLHNFLGGYQPVIPAVDVLNLRSDLVFDSDKQWFFPVLLG